MPFIFSSSNFQKSLLLQCTCGSDFLGNKEEAKSFMIGIKGAVRRSALDNWERAIENQSGRRHVGRGGRT